MTRYQIEIEPGMVFRCKAGTIAMVVADHCANYQVRYLTSNYQYPAGTMRMIRRSNLLRWILEDITETHVHPI